MSVCLNTSVTLTEDCVQSLELLLESLNRVRDVPMSRSELIEELCWDNQAVCETALRHGWEVAPQRNRPGRPSAATTADATTS